MAIRTNHLQLALWKIWHQSVGNSSRESLSCELAKLCLLEALCLADRAVYQATEAEGANVAMDWGLLLVHHNYHRCLGLQHPRWLNSLSEHIPSCREGRMFSMVQSALQCSLCFVQHLF